MSSRMRRKLQDYRDARSQAPGGSGRGFFGNVTTNAGGRPWLWWVLAVVLFVVCIDELMGNGSDSGGGGGGGGGIRSSLFATQAPTPAPTPPTPLPTPPPPTPQPTAKKPMDCGCPETCTPAALGKRNGNFWCNQRIGYLIATYGTTEEQACKGAAESPKDAQGIAPCGMECMPGVCKAA